MMLLGASDQVSVSSWRKGSVHEAQDVCGASSLVQLCPGLISDGSCRALGALAGGSCLLHISLLPAALASWWNASGSVGSAWPGTCDLFLLPYSWSVQESADMAKLPLLMASSISL